MHLRQRRQQRRLHHRHGRRHRAPAGSTTAAACRPGAAGCSCTAPSTRRSPRRRPPAGRPASPALLDVRRRDRTVTCGSRRRSSRSTRRSKQPATWRSRRRRLRRGPRPRAAAPVERPARPGRGRGREPRPADHAVLQPVPAEPLPELQLREHRHRRGIRATSTRARCRRTTGPDTPTHDRREDRRRQDLRQQRLLGHLPHRCGRPTRCCTRTMAGEIADGFVQQYRDGGWIARWSSPGYADLMTGTSSDVAFADAYLKGVELPDPGRPYDAAREERDRRCRPPRGVGRKGIETSLFLGYTSTDHRGEGCRGRWRATSTTTASRNMAAGPRQGPGHPSRRAAATRRSREYFLRPGPQLRATSSTRRSASSRAATPTATGASRRHGTTRGTGAATTPRPTAGTSPSPPRRTARAWPTCTAAATALAQKLDTFFATPETADDAAAATAASSTR